MQEVQISRQAILNPTKIKPKQVHTAQKHNIIALITQFYQKSKQKLSKSLQKQTKKATPILKQLFQLLTHHPNQQLYELIRLKDILFNQIERFNNQISSFLKQFQFLRQRLGNQLNYIHEKHMKMIQKRQIKSSDSLQMLQKVSFIKRRLQKSQLNNNNKIIKIDSLNKKIMKIESIKKQNSNQQLNTTMHFLQIQGKTFKHDIKSYFKIYFASKNRQYLAISYHKDGIPGHLSIINDKLQLLATLNHQVNHTTLINIILDQNDQLYIADRNYILRVNLKNQEDTMKQCFKHDIIAAEVVNGQVVVFMQGQGGVIYYLMLNDELEVYYQNYLKLTVKCVKFIFKINQKYTEKLYFITVATNNQEDLYEISDLRAICIIKKIGTIDEILTLKSQHVRRSNQQESSQIILRAGNKFYLLDEKSKYLKIMAVDLQTNETVLNGCVLGEHMFLLHQSGKYMFQCLLNREKNYLK